MAPFLRSDLQSRKTANHCLALVVGRAEDTDLSTLMREGLERSIMLVPHSGMNGMVAGALLTELPLQEAV